MIQLIQSMESVILTTKTSQDIWFTSNLEFLWLLVLDNLIKQLSVIDAGLFSKLRVPIAYLQPFLSSNHHLIRSQVIKLYILNTPFCR